jgi:plasmid stabilization system protein ParE
LGSSQAENYRDFVSLPVILRDEAEQDILEASRWCEDREIGLGLEFVRSIDVCLMQISRTPELGPVVYRGARMALPRRFPYLVIYKVFEDFVSVVAITTRKQTPKTLEVPCAEVEVEE